MPSEPEHPMDPSLRAYARRRREDASIPELHPANRRLLQAEVTRLRQSRQPAATGPAARSGVWPRLAFLAAACVLLTVLLTRLLPPRPSTPPEQTLAAWPQPAPAAGEPTPTDRPPAAAASRVAPPADLALVPHPPVSPASTSPAAAADRIAPAMEATPRLRSAPAPAGARSGASPLPARRYQRTDSPDGTGDVLRTFDLEQSGAEVRLVDADGSVYTGSLSATNTRSFRVAGRHQTSGRQLQVEVTFTAEPRLAARTARSAAPTPSPAATHQALQLRIQPEGEPETRTSARLLTR